MPKNGLKAALQAALTVPGFPALNPDRKDVTAVPGRLSQEWPETIHWRTYAHVKAGPLGRRAVGPRAAPGRLVALNRLFGAERCDLRLLGLG
jgi:hypothetical protein